MERCLTSRGSWLEGFFLGVFHPGLDLEDLVEEQEEGVEDGEEAGGAAQYRPLTSPDIKAEGGAAHATIRLGPQFDGHGQVAQYHIKLERPEIVMSSSAAQMMGLQRAVNNMTATRVAPQSPPASRDGPQHNMQGLQNAGYGFPHHNL